MIKVYCIPYTGKHRILELFVILGETSFCWAFSISSMLRQSLKLFIKTQLSTTRTQAALRKLEENEFHKRLRNELIMLPIPKAKFFQHKVPVGVNPMVVEDEIIEKQKHFVPDAINRVSFTGTLYFSFFTIVFIVACISISNGPSWYLYVEFNPPDF